MNSGECGLEVHGQDRGLRWRRPRSPQAVGGVMNEGTRLGGRLVQTHRHNRVATELGEQDPRRHGSSEHGSALQRLLVTLENGVGDPLTFLRS